jgi:hypothetical protein
MKAARSVGPLDGVTFGPLRVFMIEVALVCGLGCCSKRYCIIRS